MCGILGGIANIQIQDILLEGLQKLEYRGYDSAGIALLDVHGALSQIKTKGKVSELQKEVANNVSTSSTGIAHTRWATHGKPSRVNAHPHVVADRLAVVHNGIIENHEEIRQELIDSYNHTDFVSETDTEIAAWYIYYQLISKNLSLVDLLAQACTRFDGSYSLALLDKEKPSHLVATRKGSPLVAGQGKSGVFIASDPIAIVGHIDTLAILEDGDIISLLPNQCFLHNNKGKQKKIHFKAQHHEFKDIEKGEYRHFMLKEIHEQPEKVHKTLNTYSSQKKINLRDDLLVEALSKTKNIHCVACGTSYHALCVARNWIEEFTGIPCQVEVASEYRYRKIAIAEDTLFLTISQSGETADTLAALQKAKESRQYIATLAICNSPHSTLVREAEFCLITNAGIEVSVASTKAFTTQLSLLFILALQLSHNNPKFDQKKRSQLLKDVHNVPETIQKILNEEKNIEEFSGFLMHKNHSIFIGRGNMYPLAQEGALKLKEISYMYAEAYPAGELKHGPLALIDKDTPVIVVSPPTQLLQKLHSNLEEVQARGAVMLVFLDEKQKIKKRSFDMLVRVPHVDPLLAPLVYIVPLQLLAYQVAVHKGTDLDQPRNLAKSVTVE